MFRERADAIGWLTLAVAVLVCACVLFPASFQNSAKFDRTYMAPFREAIAARDPAVINSKLEAGLAGMHSLGYDHGYPNWYMPGKSDRDLGILQARTQGIADQAKALAAMDHSSGAYQFGIRSLLDHTGWPSIGPSGFTASTDGFDLYSAAFSRDGGILTAPLRDPGYSFLALILFTIIVFFPIDWLCNYSKDLGTKYFDYEFDNGIEKI